MTILITGSTGFIGSHLRARLRADGHVLVLAGRRPPPLLHEGERWLPLDFTALPATFSLASQLQGVEVAVNAVGIFRERAGQTFDALHAHGPIALFTSCAEAGVRRIVQVSALGADADATSRFLRSKRKADDALLGLGVGGAIAQPSLVYGPDGTSSRLFLTMATFPVLLLPAGGAQRVQPIHIDDLTEALAALCERSVAFTGRAEFVGAEAMQVRDYLQTLRGSLFLPRAPIVAIPAPAIAAAAGLIDAVTRRPFAVDGWAMLQRGNEGSPETICRILGRPPLGPEQFVNSHEAISLRTRAQLAWLLPVLRLSIAIVWIVTAVVSLGAYPIADSLALLERTGVPARLQPMALYGAAVLDFVLGIATVAMRRRRWLWRTQIALILAYTAIITLRLPEFWLHPYGPVLKNLPMLAALWLLLEIEGHSAEPG